MPPQVYLAVTALTISGLALFFGYLRYLTKAGISIRGEYSLVSSMACADSYVGDVVLENNKDRSATIFGIYLRIGYNYYLQIEDFENSPLVLKPFDTYRKEYDPIEFYTSSLHWILLNELLHDKRAVKRLVLSTSQGKYFPRPLRTWDPVLSFFQNHTITVIRPARSTYKGKAYGSNVIYLIEVTLENGAEQILPIHPRDYEIRRFRSFRFTKDCLVSKASLEEFIQQQRNEGKLLVKSFVVHDLNEMRSWKDAPYDAEYKAEFLSAFQVYVVGRLQTKVSNWKMKKLNKERAKEANAGNALNSSEEETMKVSEGPVPPSPTQE